MKKSSIRRADLVFSYVLMLVSIYMFIESVGLLINPMGRDFDTVTGDQLKNYILSWYKSPALMPFMLAVVIMILSQILRSIAVRDGAKFDFISIAHIKHFVCLKETRVAVIVIALFTLYIFGMIPFCRANFNYYPKFQGFPFMIATFVFLAVQMIIFNKRTIKAVLMSILVAAIAAGLITYGFGMMALIPLP